MSDWNTSDQKLAASYGWLPFLKDDGMHSIQSLDDPDATCEELGVKSRHTFSGGDRDEAADEWVRERVALLDIPAVVPTCLRALILVYGNTPANAEEHPIEKLIEQLQKLPKGTTYTEKESTLYGGQTDNMGTSYQMVLDIVEGLVS